MSKPRTPTRGELMAYCEWLFMEHRILCRELWPEKEDRKAAEAAQNANPFLKHEWRFSPSGTAANNFHIPSFDSGLSWQELPQPSTRCLAVLDAIRLKVPARKPRARA